MILGYTFLKTIGRGSMGKVKLAMNAVGEKRAIKIIPSPKPCPDMTVSSIKDLENIPSKVLECQQTYRIIREIALLMLMHHPNIVKLHQVHIQDNIFYLIFDYISGGQLLDYIHFHGSLKESQARIFFRQLISAVDYCHQNAIVHRDLKIENVLMDEGENIQLIDFGLSNLFSRDSFLSTFCGSLYFAAPELLSAQEYVGPEVDIWSMGVILYVLVCGKVPFDDPSIPMVHLKIKRGHPRYPEYLSASCRELLKSMLTVDPKKRITMKDLRMHPWVVSRFYQPPYDYMPQRSLSIVPLREDVLRLMNIFQLPNHLKDKLMDLSVQQTFKNDSIHDPALSMYYLLIEKLEKENLNSDKTRKRKSIALDDLFRTFSSRALNRMSLFR